MHTASSHSTDSRLALEAKTLYVLAFAEFTFFIISRQITSLLALLVTFLSAREYVEDGKIEMTYSIFASKDTANKT